jgi:hypothetical protein
VSPVRHVFAADVSANMLNVAPSQPSKRSHEPSMVFSRSLESA